MPDPDFLALAEASVTRPGQPCRVGETLRRLDAEQPALAAQIRTAFARTDLTNVAISRAFEAFGFRDISDGMVSHHRNGKCRNCHERGRVAA